MRKVIAIFLFSLCGFCEFTLPESGARPQGLGNAFIGLSDNVYAIITNPAGLANITSYETLFSYTTDDTKYDSLGITLPGKMKGNCGIAVLSRKNKALYFSYGRDIVIRNKALKGGTSIKLFKKENNSKGMGIDLGILYPLRNNLTFGFVLGNLLRDDFGYGFGLSFKIKGILWTADIKERNKQSLHFGIEKGMKGFFIRGGIGDKRLSLGLSRAFFGIDMDFSISPLVLSLGFGY